MSIKPLHVLESTVGGMKGDVSILFVYAIGNGKQGLVPPEEMDKAVSTDQKQHNPHSRALIGIVVKVHACARGPMCKPQVSENAQLMLASNV